MLYIKSLIVVGRRSKESCDTQRKKSSHPRTKQDTRHHEVFGIGRSTKKQSRHRSIDGDTVVLEVDDEESYETNTPETQTDKFEHIVKKVCG